MSTGNSFETRRETTLGMVSDNNYIIGSRHFITDTKRDTTGHNIHAHAHCLSMHVYGYIANAEISQLLLWT